MRTNHSKESGSKEFDGFCNSNEIDIHHNLVFT